MNTKKHTGILLILLSAMQSVHGSAAMQILQRATDNRRQDAEAVAKRSRDAKRRSQDNNQDQNEKLFEELRSLLDGPSEIERKHLDGWLRYDLGTIDRQLIKYNINSDVRAEDAFLNPENDNFESLMTTLKEKINKTLKEIASKKAADQQSRLKRAKNVVVNAWSWWSNSDSEETTLNTLLGTIQGFESKRVGLKQDWKLLGEKFDQMKQQMQVTHPKLKEPTCSAYQCLNDKNDEYCKFLNNQRAEYVQKTQ